MSHYSASVRSALCFAVVMLVGAAALAMQSNDTRVTQRQVIDYRIKPDTADELASYDGSVILGRTKGELSARCDKEEANFLAINLANDVATGKRSVADARRFYADSIARLMKDGKPTDYMQGFRFTVSKESQADPDKAAASAATSTR